MNLLKRVLALCTLTVLPILFLGVATLRAEDLDLPDLPSFEESSGDDAGADPALEEPSLDEGMPADDGDASTDLPDFDEAADQPAEADVPADLPAVEEPATDSNADVAADLPGLDDELPSAPDVSTDLPEEPAGELDADMPADTDADLGLEEPSTPDSAPVADDASSESASAEPSQPFTSSFDASSGDSLSVTQSSGALIKTGVDMAARDALVDEAKQIEEKVRQIADRLEGHKSSRYAAYLSLDKLLDAFYSEVGLSRGRLAEDISDVTEALVASAVGGGDGNVDDAMQKNVAAHKKKLRDLEASFRSVSDNEQALLKQLSELSSAVDTVLDSVVRVGSLTSQLRGLASDDAARASMEKVKAAQKEGDAAEKRVESEIGSALDKARADIEAGMQSVRSRIDELRREGMSFVETAKRILADRQPLPHAPFTPQKKKTLTSSQSNDEAQEQDSAPQKKKKRKKKRSSGGLSGLLKGTPLESAGGIFSSIWSSIKNGLSAFFALFKDAAVAFVDHVMGVEPEKGAEKKNITPAPQRVHSDPVLERIRIEREQAKHRMQSLFDQRAAIETKERLLDRLEAERIMQMDRKSEVQRELDKAYQRTDKELSWLEIAKRIMWKLHAGLRRVWISVKKMYQKKAKERRTHGQEPGTPKGNARAHDGQAPGKEEAKSADRADIESPQLPADSPELAPTLPSTPPAASPEAVATDAMNSDDLPPLSTMSDAPEVPSLPEEKGSESVLPELPEASDSGSDAVKPESTEPEAGDSLDDLMGDDDLPPLSTMSGSDDSQSSDLPPLPA